MEMRKFVTGFLVIALFAFAFISFGINFQSEWDANSSISDDPHMSTIYSGVNDSIHSSHSDVEGQKGTLYEEDPTQTGDVASLIFAGVSAIASVFTGVANGIFGVITYPLMNALGLPQGIASVIGTVLSSIFLITVVLLGWKLMKTGE